MIIQIRGTSGSGKTTVMREVMKGGGEWKKNYLEGRKKPISYVSESGRVAVLGHYEATCGGCDNIGSAPKIYDQYQAHSDYQFVISEGLLLSEDTKWTKQLLEEGKEVRIIFLTTETEECLERVRKRRREAGNDKPLKEDNTRNRVGVIERARQKLLALSHPNLRIRRAPSTQASKILLNWIKE